jgi:hypothetical protein
MTKQPASPPTPTARTSATVSGRAALDSLVQASLVDLFAAYNVGLAPLPPAPPASWTVPEVSVAVAFRRPGVDDAGRLTLSVSRALLNQMKGTDAAAVNLDWARELASQLIGRVKNRLLPFGVQLEIGGLSLLHAHILEQQLKSLSALRVYAARTLRGLVLVTLQGLPDDDSLTYVGGSSVAEGTLIWF